MEAMSGRGGRGRGGGRRGGGKGRGGRGGLDLLRDTAEELGLDSKTLDPNEPPPKWPPMELPMPIRPDAADALAIARGRALFARLRASPYYRAGALGAGERHMFDVQVGCLGAAGGRAR